MERKSEAVIFEELLTRYPDLKDCETDIRKAFEVLKTCYQQGGKVMLCGNGGSASDSDHIAGELLKSMELRRPIPQATRDALKGEFPVEGEWLADRLMQGLPAISLVAHAALLSAMDNDVDSDMAYAQQVYAYAKPGDVLVAISSSGRSKNILHAVRVARVCDVRTIALTGRIHPDLKDLCEVAVCVPGKMTADIQEYNLPVYHALCRLLENYFFE
ncbi:MAG: SIS domain-containing protein [Anaerolineaceae bacterium]|nr:SIS domain-containing protein [Anaerolineaceae bacterium]